MKLVPRRYTLPPDEQQNRSIRYINWMRAERARIDRRLACPEDGKGNPATAAVNARLPRGL